jgi:2-methylisocitrate lyase-like PEP mutase family enzyme
MDYSGSIDRATAFRALHKPGQPVVLVNVWDVASARVVAAEPGVRAVASGSWGVCAATGYDDGIDLPLDVALTAAAAIVAATDLPVTIDFEKGYSETAAGVKANVIRLIETGAIGLNIEDSQTAESLPLWSVIDAAERIAAVRAAADESGVPLVINARTDVLLGGGTAADAIERGAAYLAAGADCIFVLGAEGPILNQVVAGIPGPVSVMATANSASIAEFAEAGVARVSFGPGPMGVAYAALARLVGDLASGMPNPPELGYRPGVA